MPNQQQLGDRVVEAVCLAVLDSAAVLIFAVILVELTNTVFINATNQYLKILRRQCCLGGVLNRSDGMLLRLF